MSEIAVSAEEQTRREGMLSSFVFALALALLYASSLYSYLLFHTLVESFCTCVMLAVFVLTWNSRRLLDNHYFLVIAISFLCSGSLQLLHAFSYKGIGIFAGYDANLPTQFWIAFRYVFSLSFVAAPLFVTRRVNVGGAFAAVSLFTVVLVVAIFSGAFPDCFVEGSGLTPFKVYSEYVIIALLLAGVVLLRRRREWFDARVYRAMMAAMAGGIAADAAFTRYVSVYGYANLAGHLFLFFSTFMIYRAIVVTGIREPAAILFRNLELSKQALKSSQERFCAIHDHSPFAIGLMKPPAGEIMEVNAAWERMFGYSREEALGRTAVELGLADDPQARDRMYREIAAQGMVRDFEMGYRTRSGLKRLGSFNFDLIEIGGEKYHLGTALDVTERRRTELALKRSNERLDLLASSARELLASDAPQLLVESLCRKVMAYIGCEAFFNFLVNEEVGRLELNACAGIGEEEAAKIRWLDYGVAICGCAARDACRIVAERIDASDDPRTELVKSLGILAYACHPLMSQGRVLGTLSFGSRGKRSFTEDDLSLMKAVADQVAIAMQRKLMEEELRQAKQAAEAASRTKSQFLANMSHELRTPMTGVLGMLDLALSSPNDPQQAEYIETARRSGRSLLRILNDILDLTKVEAGKLSLDAAPFALKECVAAAVEVLVPEARRKGVALKLRLAEDLPALVVGDQVRLRQVITNLAGNSVKFTDRGEVEVRVGTGARTAEGAEIRFSVRDTGIGIPQGKRHLLFKPFSQVDDSHTRSYGGTGLGLAISKEIVERMGGTVGVESEEGRGSTFSFTVTLPVPPRGDADAAKASPAPEPPRPDAGEGKRLLVAEDDPTIRQLLATMLGRLSYRVDFAEDGRAAVSMWQEGSYDLVLMDVQMPRLDGFQATRAIREEEGTRGGRIPIIAMTAHAMKEDEARCIAAGMDCYISKPIDFRECVAKIGSLLAAG